MWKNLALAVSSLIVTLALTEAVSFLLYRVGYGFKIDNDSTANDQPSLKTDQFSWLDRASFANQIEDLRERKEKLKGQVFGSVSFDQIFPRQERGIPGRLSELVAQGNPRSTYRVISKASQANQVIFDATFNFDRHGRRISPLEEDRRGEVILLLGGSFVLGDGLNDDQTIAHYIMKHSQNSKLKSKALAWFGYGPNDLLYDFSQPNHDYFSDLKEQPVSVVYLYPEFHTLRAVGTSYAAKPDHRWLAHKPAYRISENKIVFTGTFSDQGWFDIAELFYRTYFSKVFPVRFPFRYTEEHYQLCARLLSEIKRNIEKQLNVKSFDVVVPVWGDDRFTLFENALRKENLNLIDYRRVPIRRLSEGLDQIPIDGHPSPIANDILAQILVRDLGL